MANLMKLMASEKLTENGAFARNTTFNAIVDLFAVAGALRTRDNESIIEMWDDAFNENAELAFRMLFYIRNIRGGLGERNTFRVLLKHVAEVYPDFVEANIDNIAFYGRYDDLFQLIGTPVENTVYNYIKTQLEKDDAAGENESAGIRKKPAPDMVLKSVRDLNSSVERSIYVGDSDVDIMTAKNSGMPCISVTWGFRDRKFLIEHDAEIFVDNPQEIIEYLESSANS